MRAFEHELDDEHSVSSARRPAALRPRRRAAAMRRESTARLSPWRIALACLRGPLSDPPAPLSDFLWTRAGTARVLLSAELAITLRRAARGVELAALTR